MGPGGASPAPSPVLSIDEPSFVLVQSSTNHGDDRCTGLIGNQRVPQFSLKVSDYNITGPSSSSLGHHPAGAGHSRWTCSGCVVPCDSCDTNTKISVHLNGTQMEVKAAVLPYVQGRLSTVYQHYNIMLSRLLSLEEEDDTKMQNEAFLRQ